MFSDHFGHTPLQTPFGSQDETCAIDLSDEDDLQDQELNIEDRIRWYIEECNNESGSEKSDDQDDIPVDDDIQSPDADLDSFRRLKADGCGCKLDCEAKFSEHDM